MPFLYRLFIASKLMSSQRTIFLILTDDGVCSQENFTHVILQFPAHKTFVLIVCSLRGVNFQQLRRHSLQSSLLAKGRLAISTSALVGRPEKKNN